MKYAHSVTKEEGVGTGKSMEKGIEERSGETGFPQEGLKQHVFETPPIPTQAFDLS